MPKRRRRRSVFASLPLLKLLEFILENFMWPKSTSLYCKECYSGFMYSQTTHTVLSGIVEGIKCGNASFVVICLFSGFCLWRAVDFCVFSIWIFSGLYFILFLAFFYFFRFECIEKSQTRIAHEFECLKALIAIFGYVWLFFGSYSNFSLCLFLRHKKNHSFSPWFFGRRIHATPQLDGTQESSGISFNTNINYSQSLKIN